MDCEKYMFFTAVNSKKTDFLKKIKVIRLVSVS